jgi:uncharacterized repeat protein (TIGR03843 family)
MMTPTRSGGASPNDLYEVCLRGELTVIGRIRSASNATFLCEAHLGELQAHCVYKPIAGEAPLWDFPDGTLAGREVSAYLVSAASGWCLVPPTVLRDGPLGVGACQLWIDEPASAEPVVGFVPAYELPAGWFRIAGARDEDGTAYALAHADDPRLARLAVLDAVVNNADRKGGHVLIGAGERVYGVDHGVCFNVEDKLRTVLWGWTGRRLPDEAVEVLNRLCADLDGDLGERLAAHLTRAEVARTGIRAAALLSAGHYPGPSEDWPAMPWPPM